MSTVHALCAMSTALCAIASVFFCIAIATERARWWITGAGILLGSIAVFAINVFSIALRT